MSGVKRKRARDLSQDSANTGAKIAKTHSGPGIVAREEYRDLGHINVSEAKQSSSWRARLQKWSRDMKGKPVHRRTKHIFFEEQSRVFPIMDLPRELREHILAQALVSSLPVVPIDHSVSTTFPSRRRQMQRGVTKLDPREPLGLNVAVLRLNKQIRSEAEDILYSRNVFDFSGNTISAFTIRKFRRHIQRQNFDKIRSIILQSRRLHPADYTTAENPVQKSKSSAKPNKVRKPESQQRRAMNLANRHADAALINRLDENLTIKSALSCMRGLRYITIRFNNVYMMHKKLDLVQANNMFSIKDFPENFKSLTVCRRYTSFKDSGKDEDMVMVRYGKDWVRICEKRPAVEENRDEGVEL